MKPPPPPGGLGTAPLPEPLPRLLRDLVHERTGLFFSDDRIPTMMEKLEARAVENGCASYLDYYYLLKYGDPGSSEWLRVMDVFSVQETFFWREFDQVRALVNHLVPEFFQKETRPLRIWSAACASGEEPYSIAMALMEAGWANHPIEILGSDASEAALARAAIAVFRERSFRALPANLRAKYFTPQKEGEQLRRDVVSRVTFRRLNLAWARDYEGMPQFDVIFCRNVFIYFSQQAIRRVATALAERMPFNGHLFIGASESLVKVSSAFELEEFHGSFVYRKTPPPDTSPSP